jgi:uncharacterized protein with LGFP repeats
MADVIGAIRDKWLAIGGEGFTGPALDVERPTFDGVGRTQRFERGVVISWHPRVGAHEVHGAICVAWQRSGSERGPLGYPMSDEFGDGSKRRSNFEHGFIDWTPKRGAQVHGPVRID